MSDNCTSLWIYTLLKLKWTFCSVNWNKKVNKMKTVLKGVCLLWDVELKCSDCIPSFNYSFLSSSSRLKLKTVYQTRKSFCSDSNVMVFASWKVKPIFKFVACNPCHSLPFFTIFVSLFCFIIIFFFLSISKPLFSGFL